MCLPVILVLGQRKLDIPANKADSWEEIQLKEFEKGKKESFEYKLLSHGDKLSMILENLFNMEQALFMHNMNRLSPNMRPADAFNTPNSANQ